MPRRAELAEDLRRFQAGEPIPAPAGGAAGAGVKWAKRRPAVAGSAGGSGVWRLLGLVGGGAGLRSASRTLQNGLEAAKASAESRTRGQGEGPG